MGKMSMRDPAPKIEICFLKLSECRDIYQFQEVLQSMVNDDGWFIAQQDSYALDGKDQIVVRLHKEIHDEE
ncbi:MAG: hypothetical protein ACR2QF_00970 [Geminicoccaceae bacterium]